MLHLFALLISLVFSTFSATAHPTIAHSTTPLSTTANPT